MLRLLGYRLISAVPLLFMVSIASFLLLHLMPGSPAAAILGSRATPERIAELEAHLGLDVPLFVQYTRWLGGMLSGDWGTSLFAGRPVETLMLERLPATGSLVVGGSIVALGVGLAVGTASGIWRGSKLDRSLSVMTTVGLAVPEFWVGLLLLSLFAVELDLVPVISWIPPSRDPFGWAVAMIVPSIALGLSGSASIARQMRDSMIGAMNSPFVRTLAAAGTGPRTIALRYGVKNALVPVMTVSGFYVVMIIGGSFVIEQVFSIPGLGSLTIEAINRRDMPVIQGVTVMVAIVVVVVYLLIDLATSAVNPRGRAQ